MFYYRFFSRFYVIRFVRFTDDWRVWASMGGNLTELG